VAGKRHNFFALIAKDLLIFCSIAEELANLLVAKMHIVHENEHLLRGTLLLLLLLAAHSFLHLGSHCLRGRLGVHSHSQKVLILRSVTEDLLERVGYAGCLASHPLAFPQNILAVVVGLQVNVLIELATQSGDIELSQVADLLVREL
jgi:hypothetical protein